MTDLERDIEALKTRMEALEKRVRITAVALEFLEGKVTWREGDMFVRTGPGHAPEPNRIWQIWSPEECGKPYEKWGITTGIGNSYEAERPADDRIERLYTRSEVAEIVAKSIAEHEAMRVDPVTKKLMPDLDDVDTILSALREAEEICNAAGLHDHGITGFLDSKGKTSGAAEKLLRQVVAYMRRAQSVVFTRVPIGVTLSDGRGLMSSYSDFLHKHSK